MVQQTELDEIVDILFSDDDEDVDALVVHGSRRKRASYPRGPAGVNLTIADGWDPSWLVWKPSDHISERVRAGYETGMMKLYASISPVFEAYRDGLSAELKEILRQTEFSHLIECWNAVSQRHNQGKSSLIRAFLDRFRILPTPFI